MSRRYNDHQRFGAGQIAMEVIEEGFSSGWAGSLAELERVKEILSPFNIVYVDDMRGEWRLKTTAGKHETYHQG